MLQVCEPIVVDILGKRIDLNSISTVYGW